MSRFSISGFTNRGSVRTHNEDALLLNGVVLTDGHRSLADQEYATCFVADGVGGNNAGEFASKFVLDQVAELGPKFFDAGTEILNTINDNLISIASGDPLLKGCATTFSGIAANDNRFRLYHVGDSAIWLFRGDILFKVTDDQVLDSEEPNSPITSYFGGEARNLKSQTEFPNLEMLKDDIFIICSDGLFKSVKESQMIEILRAKLSVQERASNILNTCLREGMPDNVTVALIQTI